MDLDVQKSLSARASVLSVANYSILSMANPSLIEEIDQEYDEEDDEEEKKSNNHSQGSMFISMKKRNKIVKESSQKYSLSH